MPPPTQLHGKGDNCRRSLEDRLFHCCQPLNDGPFAETKEQLGGYHLVEATDLADAIKITAKIPGARDGSIEVRAIMTM